MTDNIFETAARFAAEHSDADCDRLLLNASRYPEVDMRLAVSTITARKKLRNKLPRWASNPELVFPTSLCTEQCSSDRCAAYKASLASRYRPETIADLTGGMGADSFYLSRVCGKLHYFERQPELCSAVAYNFSRLGADNVTFTCTEISADNIMEEVIGKYSPQLIYIDPARRGKKGERVFSLRDYEPDIFGLKDSILERVPVIIVKISPMEDPDAIFNAIPECREIHAVSTANECKELLLVLERGFSGDPASRVRTAVSAGPEGTVFSLSFTKEEEASERARHISDAGDLKEGMLIADPDKSILKAGGYNIFSRITGSAKLDPSTHLYLCEEPVKGAGRYFQIKKVWKFSRQALKELALEVPVAEITAKNIPMTTDELRRKLKIKAGGPYHIWGCRAAGENVLILTVPFSS